MRHRIKLLLFPLSIIYGVIVWLRNKMFDLNILSSREFNFPVISIGNITVGGTGKTPHTEYLVSLLKNEFCLAVLSRGYKRKTKGFILAEKDATAEEIGDEPKQIKQKHADLHVAVDANRVRGINKLRDQIEDLDVVLLDDAYQHRYVKPGINILLVDYSKQIDQDYILPYGNLREPAYEKQRADIIVITKIPDNLPPIERRIITSKLKLFPHQSLFFTKIAYGNIKPLFNNNKKQPDLVKNNVIAITGIANPIPFINYLKTKTQQFEHVKFSDHHRYTAKDFKHINKKISGENYIIITTEKDAMRLNESTLIPEELKENIFYIPIEIEFQYSDKKDFDTKIVRYVRNNKRNNILYQRKN